MLIDQRTLTSGVQLIIGNGSSVKLDLDSAYNVVITVKDTIGSTTTLTELIPSAQYLMHFKRGGKALGFGKAAGADNTISFGWPVELSSGLAPIIIPAGMDLNAYAMPGMYYCPLNATAATLLNCPTVYAFSLCVGKHAGAHQMLFEYPINTPKVWVRNMSEQGMWGAWAEVLTTLYYNTYINASQFGLTITVSTTMTQVFAAMPNNSTLFLYTGGYANLRPPGGSWTYGYTTFTKNSGVYFAKYEGVWVNAGTLAYANINMSTMALDGWVVIKQI
jgi:hypothetical protein